MKIKSKTISLIFIFFLLLILQAFLCFSSDYSRNQDLDKRVRNFLDSMRNKWRDENIPKADGRVLYNLIIENNYKQALEIGTSTGRSAIWMAWALSKTGGKLITIEKNEVRYQKALANFEKAGLSDYIDARLADAHQLVPELDGPFDFVFLDADKNWYSNYLRLLLPKLKINGCFTAHNVVNLGYLSGIKNFLNLLKSLPYMETTIDRSSFTGISISFKRSGNKNDFQGQNLALEMPKN